MSPALPPLRACVTALVIAVLDAGIASAAGVPPPAALEKRCASCHRLSEPASEDRSFAAHEAQLAPDLSSAGVKYRPEWLARWLVQPTPIRPAGFHPERHAIADDGGDRVDASKLEAHPALSPAEAKDVVAALMTLDAGAERVTAGAYRKGALPKTLIELNFLKFKGCGSCHRVAEDFGGVSGPELYTAFERLQPDFLVSFIADPQAWDPRTPMPGYGLDATEASKLVDYLRTLAGEK